MPSYYSRSHVTGNGATTTFSVPFPYLDKTHVQVSINGAPTTAFTWSSPSQITFNVAPANGAFVSIVRNSSQTSILTTFSTPTTLRSADINKLGKQCFYMAQEALDGFTRSLPLNYADMWDALSKRIINVAAPVSGNDATNKTYVDTQDQIVLARTVQVPLGEPAVTIPTIANRASKLLGFDSGSNPIPVDALTVPGAAAFTVAAYPEITATDADTEFVPVLDMPSAVMKKVKPQHLNVPVFKTLTFANTGNAYNVQVADRNTFFFVDPSAAGTPGISVNLLSSATFGKGRIFVKKSDFTSNIVRAFAPGGETIEGRGYVLIPLEGDFVELVCDGTKWTVGSPGFATLRHAFPVAEHTITTANYAIDESYNGYHMVVDTNAVPGDVLMQLPSLIGANAAAFSHQCFGVWITKFDNGPNKVSIATSDGAGVNPIYPGHHSGYSQVVLKRAGESVFLWSDGARYYVMAHFPGQVNTEAKAWVKFAGASGTISKGIGVTSVTRHGAGDYSLTFTIPFATADFAVVGSCYEGWVLHNAASAQSTTSIRIKCIALAGGALFDPTSVHVVVFGDIGTFT